MVSCIIDCDTDPSTSETLLGKSTVRDHIKGGQLKLDLEEIKLWLAADKRLGEYIKGIDLIKKVKDYGYLLLNANVLDYLLDHPDFIPEKFKGIGVAFLGTIYELDKNLCARALFWNGKKWTSGHWWLEEYWTGVYCAFYERHF